MKKRGTIKKGLIVIALFLLFISVLNFQEGDSDYVSGHIVETSGLNFVQSSGSGGGELGTCI